MREKKNDARDEVDDRGRARVGEKDRNASGIEINIEMEIDYRESLGASVLVFWLQTQRNQFENMLEGIQCNLPL